MRIKIVAESMKEVSIPFNYQYVIHSAIFNLIRKSSEEYSKFLHDTGFTIDKKHIKLFTFSKLFFPYFKVTKQGFSNVKKIIFYFSTPVPQSMENLVLGIFEDQNLVLNFFGREMVFNIYSVETMAKVDFQTEMNMNCLSPIVVATHQSGRYKNKQHFLDYMKSEERSLFVNNIKNNLLMKYKLLNKEDFDRKFDFHFSFDTEYIIKRKGRISKLVEFKNGIKIFGMEAPFVIKAPVELIKVGYECGFGEKNSAGFGMAEVLKTSK